MLSLVKKLFQKIPPADRRYLAFGHDTIMAGLSFVFAMYFRLGDALFEQITPTLIGAGLFFMVLATVNFRVFGMNTGVWRYASLRDLSAILKAVTVTIGVFIAAMFMFTRAEEIPRSVPILNWLFLVVMLGGPRLMYRMMKDQKILRHMARHKDDRVAVLLVGAGDGAELFIRAMLFDASSRYRVVGVLDDKGRRVGREIHGVPILGTMDEIEPILKDLTEKNNRPQKMILTKMHDSIDGENLRKLVEKAEAMNLTLARLPALTDFKSDILCPTQDLQPIAITDLLGRDQIALNQGAIGELITHRTVIVTGAGGSIGSELCRQVAARAPSRLVLIENSEFNLYSIDIELRETYPHLEIVPILCDVRERETIMRHFEYFEPQIVFHAAALKHVPMVEMNVSEGVITNAIGSANVADAAAKVGAYAMVQISTDKAVNPTNVMGASKRVAESYCQALDMKCLKENKQTRFMTVRFGNVLGSTGSVVPRFEKQLRAGGPLTVTHPEIRRYFMTIREAVELVLQASAYGMEKREERGRIFVLDMGEPIKIIDLARKMIRLAGLRPDEDIKIDVTGLRPGEKLYEELFDTAEPPVPTGAEGVMSASPRIVEYEIIHRSIEELKAATRDAEHERVLMLLKHIVPEFRHNKDVNIQPIPSTKTVTENEQ